MEICMVIPTYWTRKKVDGFKKGDRVFDHPTYLDESGTLLKCLKSTSILENRDFKIVVIGVPVCDSIGKEVDEKVKSILDQFDSEIETYYFGMKELNSVYDRLREKKVESYEKFVNFNGYSQVRNLCLFIPEILNSDVALLIDDDEFFTDDRFINRVEESMNSKVDEKKIQALAGYYTYNGEYLLDYKKEDWMEFWDKPIEMNRAFNETIGKEPRLKKTSFVFGGNMALKKDIFQKFPFDPKITRGEDIDYLMNLRFFGVDFYLDNQLAIEHDAPPNINPKWRQLREDFIRFVYQKNKLDTQVRSDQYSYIEPEDLDPYPGTFLKYDLMHRISQTCKLKKEFYISKNMVDEAIECEKTHEIIREYAKRLENEFEKYIEFKEMWEKFIKDIQKIDGLYKMIYKVM